MISTNPATQSAETILINKGMNGNLETFNQLVWTHQNMVYNHAYAMLGDTALAEDATEDGFIKAFQGIQSFRGGSFRDGLLKIVTNSAYDILRRAQRHPTQAPFPEEENGEEIESAQWLADPSTSVQYAEAAQALKFPIGTVKSRLARARLRMKEKSGSIRNTPFSLYCPA